MFEAPSNSCTEKLSQPNRATTILSAADQGKNFQTEEDELPECNMRSRLIKF